MNQLPTQQPYAWEPPAPPGALPRRPEKGLSATGLKYIAIAAMLIDHIAWAFVPTTSALGIAMHFVGRITGPTMFYFVAEGYRHTRNVNRYTLRLAVFALVSWFPFYYFEMGSLPFTGGGFFPMGVIYTLFLALLAVRARHEVQNPLLRVLAILGLVLLSFVGDWPIFGILMALVFDAFYERPRQQALMYLLVVLGSILPDLLAWLTLVVVGEGAFPAGMLNPNLDAAGLMRAAGSSVLLNLGQVLPLILLQFYTGRRGGGSGKAASAFNKWFFYIFYPLHLVVLGLLRWVALA